MISPDAILKRLWARRLGTLIERVAQEHHVTPIDIVDHCRLAQVCRARNAFCWELRKLGFSYPEIGILINRDHTSVMHAVRMHEKRIADAAA